MDIFSSVYALRAALRNVPALKKKKSMFFLGVVLDPVHSMATTEGRSKAVGMCAGSN